MLIPGSKRAATPLKKADRPGLYRPSVRRAATTALAAALLLTACGEPTIGEAARDRAQELESALADSEGPAGEHLALLFGDDGAHLCAAADSVDHLSQVALIPNGFALRKLTVARSNVEFAGAVIDVYCPQNRDPFDEYVSGLETGKPDG